MLTDKERYQRSVELLDRPTTIITRPIWIGCDGYLRCGRTLDMIELLDALKSPTRQ